MVIGALVTSEFWIPDQEAKRHQLNHHSGILLRLHPSQEQRSEPGFQLRHHILPQHLLRMSLRLHAGSDAFGSPSNGQWHLCRL